MIALTNAQVALQAAAESLGPVSYSGTVTARAAELKEWLDENTPEAERKALV